MAIIGKLGKKALNFAADHPKTVMGGALLAGLTSGDAANENYRSIFNATIGTVGDGSVGADEAIMGRPIDFTNLVGQSAMPSWLRPPQGWQNLRYLDAEPDTPGLQWNTQLVNNAVQLQKYQNADFAGELAQKNVYNSRNGVVSSRNVSYSTYRSTHSSNRLNASGEQVLNSHRGRFN